MWKVLLGLFLSLLIGATASAQPANYKVKSGDRLSIEVLEDPSLNRVLLVLPDGSISFPMAGTIPAAGKSVSQIAGNLTQALLPNFAARPSVYVSVQSVALASETAATTADIEVYLVGEVAKPGQYEVSSGTTVLQFLAQSGGFTRFAAKKRIQLRRIDRKTGTARLYSIDYRSLERGGSIARAAMRLQRGDVILVPERRLFE